MEIKNKENDETYDKVKLANIAKESIESFNEMMNNLQSKKLVVFFVYAEDEVKTSITTENQLKVFSPFNKVAQAR